ncbi:hypothetical protein [Vibrio sp. Vb339]|uniref:hypothetical protein n=1 Tax=Vibrio sp. Vb339 TaxID=1192013 RepID=UPI00155245C2|nr:hypothetical protein [Vibrio sp. Vb339]
MLEIFIGRFDDFNEFKIKRSGNKTRITSKNQDSIEFHDFIAISSNGFDVIYNGQLYSLEKFTLLVEAMNLRDLIVLTSKEKMLLAENGFNDFHNVYVLEENFPVFPGVKYHDDLTRNFHELSRCLIKIRSLGIRGVSLGIDTVTRGMRKVNRKIRWKNELDSNFYFSTFSGYQEVFKIKEECDNRVVIALDYNSMFASCMSGDFLDPKKLSYKTFNIEFGTESIKPGFYRVRLVNPKTSFIKKFHPFRFVKLKKSYAFKMKDEDVLELFLFESEIEYYSGHFESVIIIDGIISDDSIKHPLANYSNKLYNKRLKAKKENNRTLELLLKFKLAMLHSSTNKVFKKRKNFDSKLELVRFVEREFCFVRPDDCSINTFLDFLAKTTTFSIEIKSNGILLEYPSYNESGQIFSLTARVLANARLKMTKTIEYLLDFESIELCYVNVDSIHISIPKTLQPAFFHYSNALISEGLGDLKIQSIASRGYWLDVGRYWLIDNGNVKKFANVGFNSSGSDKPFVSQRKKLIRYKSSAFDFCKPYYVNIEDSFTFKNRLLNDGKYERYSFEEINSLEQMFRSEQLEACKTLQRKASIFYGLRDIIGR